MARTTRISALAASVAVLVGCHDAASTSGTAVVLLETNAQTLDRRFAQSAVAQRVADLVTPGLITFDDHFRPVGDLAEAIEARSPIEYAFRLRPGLVFSTGERLTADDVVATYRSLGDPAVASPLKSRLDGVADIEATNEREVVFRLKEPYAPFVSELVLGILPRRLTGADALDETAHRPVGAGPFVVESAEDEDTLILASNPRYFGGKPAIDRVVFRTVRDETTRVLELLKGRADLAVGEVSPEMIPELARSPKLAVLNPGGSGYAYLAFNLRSGPTSDLRIRQAIDCALDRKEIATVKFRGLAHPATSMMPKTHWAYAPAALCEHDLARASALLDEAGYPDTDGDGHRSRHLHLVYKTSSDRFRRSVALIIADQLRQVGIDVEVRSEEFSTFFAQIQHGAFEMASLKWAAVMEPDLMRWVFGCSMVPTEANHFVGWNRGGYCNPALDPLLESALRSNVESERTKAYTTVQEVLAHDVPYVPLWHEDNVAVVSRRLRGFEASPHGLLSGLARASVIERSR